MAIHSNIDSGNRFKNKSLERMRCDVPAVYQVIVMGRLDSEWAVTFGDLNLQVELAADGAPITIMCGVFVDQAALHGLLQEIRDLGLTLLLVEYLDLMPSGNT